MCKELNILEASWSEQVLSICHGITAVIKNSLFGNTSNTPQKFLEAPMTEKEWYVLNSQMFWSFQLSNISGPLSCFQSNINSFGFYFPFKPQRSPEIKLVVDRFIKLTKACSGHILPTCEKGQLLLDLGARPCPTTRSRVRAVAPETLCEFQVDLSLKPTGATSILVGWNTFPET